MSIREAIARASKETLATYLSPELCEQLTDEIVHRATAELESALQAFVGFDGLRTAAKSPSLGRKGPSRRGRKARAEAGTGEGAPDGDLQGGPSDREPSPEQMV